ncbi:MAG TPA: sigma-70 factor domain-containing protein, partial [Geobacteraceae bacterium]|nr:sigma-70 factor domain-containing protein [Geobacteraceae bacterium]
MVVVYGGKAAMTMNLPIVADSFTLYLAEIRRFPLLDAEEEKRLAVSFYEEKDLA